MSENTGLPLRVWLLSDEKPGHYNLSRGIVAALQRIQPLELSWITLRMRVGLARNVLRAYLNRIHSPASPQWLSLFYRMDPLPREACNLIVSAGGKTSFANAWLAHCMRVPNLYAGSLRRLSPTLFSVVLTLEPIEGAANNLVVDLPPCAIDFDRLQSAGARLLNRSQLGGRRCWTLLVGGNGAGYEYRQHDWRTLAQMMNAVACRYGICWLLASSRRTGGQAERLLRHSVDSRFLVAPNWYHRGEIFNCESFLGAADRVFVTEDSMTMLTEAIYSRRPVVSLRPRSAAPTGRYERMLRAFAESGYIRRYGLGEIVRQPALLEETGCRILQSSPIDSLAKQLQVHLGMTKQLRVTTRSRGNEEVVGRRESHCDQS